MLAVNRSPVTGIPLMIRSTANPGGPGHEWVRRRFDPPPEPKHGYILGPRIVVDGIDRRAICPPTWRIVSGFDWGESKPFGRLWFAISDGSPIKLQDRTLRFMKGDVVVFDELYGCRFIVLNMSGITMRPAPGLPASAAITPSISSLA
jgi:hypothetical protein